MLNQTSDELKLEKHPDKTVQARTERGFEFMGYHSQSGKLYVAGYTLERFKQRIARLYEFRFNSVQWLQPKPFMDCSYWSD